MLVDVIMNNEVTRTIAIIHTLFIHADASLLSLLTFFLFISVAILWILLKGEW